jgi:hypothetical protein
MNQLSPRACTWVVDGEASTGGRVYRDKVLLGMGYCNLGRSRVGGKLGDLRHLVH